MNGGYSPNNKTIIMLTFSFGVKKTFQDASSFTEGGNEHVPSF